MPSPVRARICLAVFVAAGDKALFPKKFWARHCHSTTPWCLEALWSGLGGNVAEVYPRLLQQRCRMLQRGILVTPLQPGFC